MQTTLRYAPLAENAPRFAADIVTVVREGAQIRLDYTPNSLFLVDQLIDGIKNEGAPLHAVAETLVGFGAYIGEVLVLHAGAHWVDFDQSQRELFGHAFGVKTPDSRAWNPLGKVFKRYGNGSGDSVHSFYTTASALPSEQHGGN